MNETSEFTNTQFLEHINSEKNTNERLIRERLPETLRQNYENASQALNDYYFALRTREKRFPIIPPNRNKIQKELDDKTKIFREYFDREVFSTVVHASDEDLADENGYAVLKSPVTQANEQTLETKARIRHQGNTDERISSNNLVFANSRALRSRSFSGKYTYQIESRDGCVVPLDIADILAPGIMDQSKYADALRIYFTSRNIFSVERFEDIFSRYCATVFDKPEDALTFFQQNYFLPQRAGVWDSADSVSRNLDKRSAKASVNIRELYVYKGLVPPFSPEWQFRDSVKARKIV